MKIERNCPDCKKNINYSSINVLKRAEKNNAKCKECSQKNRFKDSVKQNKEKWILECKKCRFIKVFKSYNSFKNSERVENYKCMSCSSKEVYNRPGEKERMKKISSHPGKKNPMYGKTFYNIWIEKYGKKEADNLMDIWVNNLESKSGENNPMHGKSFYDIWIEKYGKEEADKLLVEYGELKSKQTSGKNNPMYGKPSPVGSGNGWSGWYKGWYFRSLNELSYMVSVIERFNIKWESAETKKWSVKYIDWNGIERNYFPDFILSGKYMVECKPKNLWNSETNRLKKGAAVEMCKELGLIYKMVNPKKLTDNEIEILYNEGKIKFLDRYDEKFKKRLQK